MDAAHVQQEINLALSVPVKSYTGEKDLCTKNGYGKQRWVNNYEQYYTGHFHKNSLNKKGKYEWKYDNNKCVYEGKIYANNIEGYGTFSYADGSYFEGLFRCNQRYGPGVFTYPNGSQDVGLWAGLVLFKLSCNATFQIVPSLATTLKAKAFLVQFKKLVNVEESTFTEAEKILIDLNADPEVLKNSSKLCNKYVRNITSKFFDKKNYDKHYYSDIQPVVDAIVTYGENGEPVVKEMEVSHILAWNNDDQFIDLLKYTFLHRSYENTITYDINQVLTGERDMFREAGKLEKINIEFIIACSTEDNALVSKLMTKNDLNPNVCDITGTCGIHCAAYNNCHPTIRTLANFGADLDRENDEGLTPLLFCVLHFLATKFKVTDWEKGFLSLFFTLSENIQWRPCLSPKIHCIPREVDVSSSTAINNNPNQNFILNLNYGGSKDLRNIGKVKKDIKIKQKAKTESLGRVFSDHKKKIKVRILEGSSKVKQDEQERSQKLLHIRETVDLLLYYGANPNLGEVPLPPLALAIFSKDEHLTHSLIRNGANCNLVLTKEFNLTPLHIVASIEPSEQVVNIAQLLIDNGADVNMYTNTQHWEIEKDKILEGITPKRPDHGKTPLHILALRYDYKDDLDDYLLSVFDILVQKSKRSHALYLGHNVLSLAILRCNLKLIKHLFITGRYKPNDKLPSKLGVPLTVLINKKYAKFNKSADMKDLYSTLHEFNANAFNVVNNNLNALEFSEELLEKSEEVPEGNKPTSKKSENRSKKSGKNNKLKNKTSKNSVKAKPNKKKKSKDKRPKKVEGPITLLIDNAYDTLSKYIQGQVIQFLWKYKIECDLSSKMFDAMAGFITFQEAEEVLQKLIDNNVITPKKKGLICLLSYIRDKGAKSPKKEKKKSKIRASVNIDLETIANSLLLKTQQDKPLDYPAIPPELDTDHEKYKVCYKCLKRLDKILILCPGCESVYFCSEQCNKQSINKRNQRHKCKELFYTQMLKRIQCGKPVLDKKKKFEVICQEIAKSSQQLMIGSSALSLYLKESLSQKNQHVSIGSLTPKTKKVGKDSKSTDIHLSSIDKKEKGNNKKEEEIPPSLLSKETIKFKERDKSEDTHLVPVCKAPLYGGKSDEMLAMTHRGKKKFIVPSKGQEQLEVLYASDFEELPEEEKGKRDKDLFEISDKDKTDQKGKKHPVEEKTDDIITKLKKGKLEVSTELCQLLLKSDDKKKGGKGKKQGFITYENEVGEETVKGKRVKNLLTASEKDKQLEEESEKGKRDKDQLDNKDQLIKASGKEKEDYGTEKGKTVSQRKENIGKVTVKVKKGKVPFRPYDKGKVQKTETGKGDKVSVISSDNSEDDDVKGKKVKGDTTKKGKKVKEVSRTKKGKTDTDTELISDFEEVEGIKKGKKGKVLSKKEEAEGIKKGKNGKVLSEKEEVEGTKKGKKGKVLSEKEEVEGIIKRRKRGKTTDETEESDEEGDKKGRKKRDKQSKSTDRQAKKTKGKDSFCDSDTNIFRKPKVSRSTEFIDRGKKPKKKKDLDKGKKKKHRKKKETSTASKKNRKHRKISKLTKKHNKILPSPHQKGKQKKREKQDGNDLQDPKRTRESLDTDKKKSLTACTNYSGKTIQTLISQGYIPLTAIHTSYEDFIKVFDGYRNAFPLCIILINGQLYYKFIESNLYCKGTYSSV